MQLGTSAREYRVHCLETSTTELYVAFLTEIYNPTRPLPNIMPEEYSSRLLRKVSISSYIHSGSVTLTPSSVAGLRTTSEEGRWRQRKDAVCMDSFNSDGNFIVI